MGADASVAAGPVGRQASIATDPNFSAEVYSYSRTRGLFAGISLDGTVLSIDRSANALFYNKPGVTASEILAGGVATTDNTAQRFLAAITASTGAACADEFRHGVQRRTDLPDGGSAARGTAEVGSPARPRKAAGAWPAAPAFAELSAYANASRLRSWLLRDDELKNSVAALGADTLRVDRLGQNEATMKPSLASLAALAQQLLLAGGALRE